LNALLKQSIVRRYLRKCNTISAAKACVFSYLDIKLIYLVTSPYYKTNRGKMSI